MNETNSNEREIDLGEILLLLFRSLPLLLVVTVVFAAAGFAGTKYLITPQYQASVTMIVNNRTSGSNATTDTISTSDLSASETLVDTYAVIIKSDTVLSRVIDDLGLNTSYDALAARVSVASVNNTQVMRVSLNDPSPSTAVAIVQKISEIAPDIIVDKVKAGSCEVISSVRATNSPVSPSITRNTAIAALLGLLLSAAFVIIRHLLDNTFHSEDDITSALGLSVLSTIPLVDEKGN